MGTPKATKPKPIENPKSSALHPGGEMPVVAGARDPTVLLRLFKSSQKCFLQTLNVEPVCVSVTVKSSSSNVSIASSASIPLASGVCKHVLEDRTC